MPNPIKYTTGSETLALKKGNFWIGTGDVGKGPTSSTGYYNGITPPSGGYAIYLNKETGGPSIYTVNDDTQLISLTNSIAGQSYTTVNECLVYFAGQTDKMSVNRDYEGIVTNGLVLNVDAGFTPSYPRSGTTWSDVSLSGNTGTLTNGPTFDLGGGGSIVFDGTNDQIIFPSSFNATTAGLTGYHSVEMWVKPDRVNLMDDGLFRSLNGGGGTGRYLHYIIRQSRFHLGWYSIDTPGSQIIEPNTWYQVVFLFDVDDRQKIYVNGNLDAQGIVISNNPNLIDGKFYNGGTGLIQIGFYSAYFKGLMPISRVYNRALTASEVLQNYNAQKSRFGL
jgi:hypothetical protein